MKLRDFLFFACSNISDPLQKEKKTEMYLFYNIIQNLCKFRQKPYKKILHAEGCHVIGWCCLCNMCHVCLCNNDYYINPIATCSINLWNTTGQTASEVYYTNIF